MSPHLTEVSLRSEPLDAPQLMVYLRTICPSSGVTSAEEAYSSSVSTLLCIPYLSHKPPLLLTVLGPVPRPLFHAASPCENPVRSCTATLATLIIAPPRSSHKALLDQLANLRLFAQLGVYAHPDGTDDTVNGVMVWIYVENRTPRNCYEIMPPLHIAPSFLCHDSGGVTRVANLETRALLLIRFIYRS